MKKPVFSVLSVFLLLLSCQGKPPVISGVEWSLFQIKNTADGSFKEQLSVFVRAEDPDGGEDIEDLYLSSTGSRLYWHLTGETWEKRSRGNELWIGSTSITSPAGIPRGEYRVELIDRGGERTTDSIYIDLPDFNPDEYTAKQRNVPELEIEGETGKISGSGGPYQCVAMDGDGQITAVFETSSTVFDISEYRSSGTSGGTAWYVFEFEPNRGWYIGSGPY